MKSILDFVKTMGGVGSLSLLNYNHWLLKRGKSVCYTIRYSVVEQHCREWDLSMHVLTCTVTGTSKSHI